MIKRFVMKGLSPVIPVTALIVITAVLAFAAYAILLDYNSLSTGSSFRVEPGACSSGDGSLVSVRVTNLGNTVLETRDFTFSQVDGTSFEISPGFSIQPGESAVIQHDCSSPSGCASGTHSVVLGTSAGVSTVNVFCT